MKFFKASGLWFPADEPENRVAGTLRFSESGLQLKLLGGFQGGWSPDVQAYGIIQGVVGDSPYGEFVSLYDCFPTSKSLRSQGIGSETIRCERAYIGDDYLFEEEADIRSISLATSYLYDWARLKDVSDFKFGLPPWHEVGIQNGFPEPVRFDIDDAIVLVVVSYSSHSSTRAAGIRATSSISITPRTTLRARAIAGKFVQRLCDLLSFATDRPNAVEEVALTQTKGTGVSKRHYLLYDRILQLKDQRSGLYKGDMLFSLSEAIEAGLNIFQGWLDFTNKNAKFCMVYFASLYAQPKYLDEKFQRLISAFTLLCGSLSEATPQTIQFVEDISRTFNKSFTDKDRLLLYHLLPTPPKVQMTLDMRRLLEEHARLMGQVIGDFDEFVMAVSTTLRYIETREGPQGHPKLEGAELHYAMQKIRMLIKILVLGQLGFDGGRVASFIERNMDFLHLKALLGKS
jgi:ApeA N-terminal domain 1